MSFYRSTNLRDEDVAVLKTLPDYNYEGTRPKWKTITTLSPQQQQGTQPKPK